MADQESFKDTVTINGQEAREPVKSGTCCYLDVRSMTEKLEVVIEENSSLALSSTTQQSQDCTIRIVKRHGRSQQESTDHYTPRVISIGPLHYGKRELKPMEDLKKMYQNNLLNRRGEGRKEELRCRFKKEAREMEQKARGYYELPNIISSNEFVDILVLDGCFLIEFLLICRDKNFTTMDDVGWKLPLIKHDILLFENQLPFFVLKKLYDIFLELDDGGTAKMVEIASDYLYYTELWDQKRNFWAYYETRVRTDQIGEPFHLLHLYHKILFGTKHKPPFSKIMFIRNWTMSLFTLIFGAVSFPMFLIHQLFFADNMYPTKLTSAMELEEAGVRFQGSCMDLRFEKGTICIPILTLNHQSFCLLKNLLAFEFYHPSTSPPYVHTYADFLSDLIKHPGDLKVMEEHHIITVRSDGNGSVQLVNDLLEGGMHNYEVLTLKDGFGWQCPRDRGEALMKYCKEPRHRWRAKLMKEYFGNPWSTLGFLVGVLLLILTTLQTVFTVLSYYHPQMSP